MFEQRRLEHAVAYIPLLLFVGFAAASFPYPLRPIDTVSLLAGVWSVPIGLLLRSFARDARRRALEAHEWLVCTECLYPLRGCPAQGACPECGKPYTHEATVESWKFRLAPVGDQRTPLLPQAVMGTPEARLIRLRRLRRWAARLVRGGGLAVAVLAVTAPLCNPTAAARSYRSTSRTIGALWEALGALGVTMAVAGVLLYLLYRIGLHRVVKSGDWLICRECSCTLDGPGVAGACPECGTPYTHDDTTRAWQREFRVIR